MNIALFSDSYIPTKSGVVTVVVQLKKILEELGHHVVIVTVNSSENINIHSDRSEKDVLRVSSISSPLGEGQYMGFPHKRKIIKFLLENNIELIHAHTEFSMGHAAISAGKHLNIPVIATTHTMWEDYYRYYLVLGNLIPPKMIRKFVKVLYKRFFALINVSKKAKNYFTSPFMLPFTPCATIPNAIDAQKFSGQKITDKEKHNLRKSLGIKDDDKVILYVGRVVEEKRVMELLDVAKYIVRARNNVKMIFVGSGAALGTLKEEVEDENLTDKIIFTGFIDWQKVYAYYSIGDMFVTTSLSEMHSMTILEALSMGLPTVCRKDSSYEDTIFHGENGYFASNEDEVASYLLELCDSKEKCEKMSEAAKKIADRFTLRLHGLRTVAFYKKVLENYPKKVSSKELQAAVNSVE